LEDWSIELDLFENEFRDNEKMNVGFFSSRSLIDFYINPHSCAFFSFNNTIFNKISQFITNSNDVAIHLYFPEGKACRISNKE
jgi:peptidase E